MTNTNEMTSLELDSQVQLLSRIQFLTRFSSNLLKIAGETGSGKSWLSERYLESWASEPVQALLICNQQQKEHQHRSFILSQLARDVVFNEHDSLLQSLQHMIEDRSCHLLVVIDDAHLLSDTLVGELWAVVQEAQQRQNWQINVLLFGEVGKLTGEFARFSTTQGVSPLTLEISPLSDSERDMFIDVMMINRQLDASQRRKIRQDAQSLPSIPGALKGLGRQETTAMKDNKDTPLWPLMILALFLIVIGAGAVWWFWPQPEQEQKNNALIPQGIDELTAFVEKLNQTNNSSSGNNQQNDALQNAQDTADQTPDASGNTVSRSDDSSVNRAGGEGQTVGRQTDTTGTLSVSNPTSASQENTATTGNNTASSGTLDATTTGIGLAVGSGQTSSGNIGLAGSSGNYTSQSGGVTSSGAIVTSPGEQGTVRREAVYVSADQQSDDNAELPPQLALEGVTVGTGGDQNKRIVVPDLVVDAIIDQQAAGSDGTSAVNNLLPELANAVRDDVTQNQNTSVRPVRQGFSTKLSNQALLTVNDNRYALQLAALQSREAVDNFVTEYNLSDKVRVYETRRNGDPWFMVLLGDYPSVSEARKAGLILPDDIQSLSPWAKAFSQIHQEIRRVN
ncbi:AAA family ATPase [Veronia pacifica]|uniref:SPOR domain-containing protein n=1 Tax=Veronia pacifica TaxID=1080227 RepID=A0A1C3EGK4_9GAMM|nr:AAA family ATPase [Veronia pacifica]ODA32360.1 hypothetical protein A8L45_12875 [Veronia pacifica]